jgi:hypothetical protein
MIGKNVMGSDAEHADALLFALCIIVGLIAHVVNYAINFDGEIGCVTKEIHDIANWMLPPELQTVGLGFQFRPQQDFGG